jgi:hypothetical protein
MVGAVLVIADDFVLIVDGLGVGRLGAADIDDREGPVAVKETLVASGPVPPRGTSMAVTV